MALSTEQTIALFEILEVPYSDTIGKIQDPDNLRVLEYTVEATATGAKARIEAHLAGMASATETILAAYLDEWIDLGTCAYEMSGGVGDIQGITFSDDAERDVIRRRVIVLVPYYRVHEEMENRHRAGRNIALIR